MSQLAVFAYASLVNLDSASRTLGRPVSPSPPLRLRGWRRRWSTFRDNLRCEKTFALPGGEVPPHVLGLNVEPSEEDELAPNGVLLELTPDELERLDLREVRYRRIEVTDRIEVAGFGRVFTYTAKAPHFAPEPPPGAVILASYAFAVQDAFATLGDGEASLYRDTTGEPPVEVVEAELVRDRILPGNPHEW